VGSLSVAVEILQHPNYDDKKALFRTIKDNMNYLVTARPTAVNMNKAANFFTEIADYLSYSDEFTLSQMKDEYL